MQILSDISSDIKSKIIRNVKTLLHCDTETHLLFSSCGTWRACPRMSRLATCSTRNTTLVRHTDVNSSVSVMQLSSAMSVQPATSWQQTHSRAVGIMMQFPQLHQSRCCVLSPRPESGSASSPSGPAASAASATAPLPLASAARLSLSKSSSSVYSGSSP